MADCKYESWLMPHHDGELPPERGRELEEHLAECPLCALELRRLRASSRLLGEAVASAMPEGMIGRLYEAVRPVRDRGIIRLCRTVALAAATLLVVCGGWLWYGTPGDGPGAGPPAEWEMRAVTLDTGSAQDDSGEALALWIVSDLSRENGW